jgi:hypothetical protein
MAGQHITWQKRGISEFNTAADMSGLAGAPRLADPVASLAAWGYVDQLHVEVKTSEY